jgi:hypothetical protein
MNLVPHVIIVITAIVFFLAPMWIMRSGGGANIGGAAWMTVVMPAMLIWVSLAQSPTPMYVAISQMIFILIVLAVSKVDEMMKPPPPHDPGVLLPP